MSVFINHDFSTLPDNTSVQSAWPESTNTYAQSAETIYVDGGALAAHPATFDTYGGGPLIRQSVPQVVRRIRMISNFLTEISISEGVLNGYYFRQIVQLYANNDTIGFYFDAEWRGANDDPDYYRDHIQKIFHAYTTGVHATGAGTKEFVGLAEIVFAADGSFTFLANGQSMPIYFPYAAPGDQVRSKMIQPAELLSNQIVGVGFGRGRDANNEISSQITGRIMSIVCRDDAERTSITGISKQRYDGTRSTEKIVVTTNSSAVTHYNISVQTYAGLEVATASGAADPSGTTTLNTTPVDPQYAGVPLVARLTTDSGDPNQNDLSYFVGPYTALQRPLYLGYNQGGLSHYGRVSYPANLLSVGGPALLNNPSNNDLKMPWNTDDDYPGLQPASIIGMQKNSWPTKFPPTGQGDGINFRVPWRIQDWMNGQYFVLDLSQQPGLIPRITKNNDAPKVIDLNYFGPGKHRLYIEDHIDHSQHTIIDADLWQINFYASESTFVDPATLPPEGWAPSLRRVDDSGAKLYSPDEFKWHRKLNLGARYMSDMLCNIGYFNDWNPTLDKINADCMVRPEGGWETPGNAHYPFEFAAQKAVDTGTWLYFNIGHHVAIDYAVKLQTLAKNYPTLHIVWQFSNETWNTGFAQASYMAGIGFARGLGKIGARYGQYDNLPAVTEYLNGNAPYSNHAIGARAIWRGEIYELTSTQDVTKDPNDTASGWTFEQRFADAQARWMSERVREMVDAMKAVAGDAAWGTQYMFIVDTWQIQPSFCLPVLEWGPMDADGNVIDPLGAHVHGVCTATYFADHVTWKDPPNNGPGARGTPQSILNANPGADRIAAMIAQTRVEMEGVLTQWSEAQTYFAQLNNTKGWNLELMCYEGGINMEVLAPVYNADGTHQTDQSGNELVDTSWMIDVVNMVRSPEMREITREWFRRSALEAGGHFCMFDADGANWYGDHNFGGYCLGFWGLSKSPTDYSPRYMGLIDAQIDLGIYRDPDALPAAPRRPMPMLRRLAANALA